MIASAPAQNIPKAKTTPEYPAVEFHRFTVEEYDQFAEMGVFGEENTVELLDGWIVDKMSKNGRHMAAYSVLVRILIRLLPDHFGVMTQDPIALSRSKPEPDISIKQGEVEELVEGAPEAGALLVVVEISHSTLQQDQTLKQRIYAEARIPFYWILNLIDDVTEVYANPHGDGEAATYDPPTLYTPNELVPLILNGKEFARLDLSHCYGKPVKSAV